MVVMALDFRKAFDIVDRKGLVETMVRFKINPLIINLIAKLYSGDETVIKIGGKEVKFQLRAGIRQGCTTSTMLFKLVTYEIMRWLEEVGVRFETRRYSLNSIFFADDNLMVAKTLAAARRNLLVVREAGKAFGLEINESKSKVMVYRVRGGRGGAREEVVDERVEGMEVVRELQYLGIKICDEQDIFGKHREEVVKKAELMSMQTYSVIERCCNKVMIGKTFWKTIVLPAVLMGVGLMSFTKKQTARLQMIEDGVLRKVLGARSFAPLAVMRGEVGVSCMRSRLIQSRLLLVKSMMEGPNELMRVVMGEVRADRFNKTNISIKSCMRELGMEYRDLEVMSKAEIKRKVREWDTDQWLALLRGLSTADLYLEFKGVMREEKVYDNKYSSELLFAARSNTLELNELRGRWGKGSPACWLCGEGREDLMHFVLKCPPLEGKRRDVIGKYEGESDRSTLGALLFGTGREDCEEVKGMLQDLWVERRRKLGVMGIRREGRG